ncbi:MAG: type toxin-antitoxin system death-on-curing family toxin [Planctomycetota bacterium]|nr:type toxin-antitoxin system death-on-curing family toxin [Planctomycetota bacterium]
MPEIRYLTSDDLIALHGEVVARSGGLASPLVAPDKLDSALNRPRHAAWYEGADLVRQAVLLAVGISQSQAFLDGNKRAAFAALDVFLLVNGLSYRGESLALARWIESIGEAGRTGRDALTDQFGAWLRGCVEPDQKGTSGWDD